MAPRSARRKAGLFRHAEDAPWAADDRRPDLLARVYRYKTLLGTPEAPCPDAAMGIVELFPGTYPFHEHPAPEVYYVVRGDIEWTVGETKFRARAGTAVYHPAGARHRMTTLGEESGLAVWFWWAPGGDREVLGVPSRLSEG